MWLETNRLIIRSIQRGDEIIFSGMSQDGSLSQVGFDANCSEWINDWIEEALKLTNNDNPRENYIPCTVILKETEEVIGSVGSTYYEDVDKVGICYFIGTPFRKKGYMTEAINAYVQFLIETIQQHVNGKAIYIPSTSKKEWGSHTDTRQYLIQRNHEISQKYQGGSSIASLAMQFSLSEKSIQRIVREGKRKSGKL